MGAVNNAARLPWHLWTRSGQFFVGCIWGVRINAGDVEDLPRFAGEQQVRGVEPGCKTKPLACAHQQCSHGHCQDRSVGFVCDCASTPYTGPLCDEGPLASCSTVSLDFLKIGRQPLMKFLCNASLISLYSKSLLIMAALRSRCGHYIFALWFLLSFFFFFFYFLA